MLDKKSNNDKKVISLSPCTWEKDKKVTALHPKFTEGKAVIRGKPVHITGLSNLSYLMRTFDLQTPAILANCKD
jgi:hypothetical protein